MIEPKFGKYKIIITGNRDYKDYNHLKEILNKMLENLLKGDVPIEIVIGDCYNIDNIAARYAIEELKYDIGNGIRKFPIQWSVYGKKARYVRNKEMVDYSTHLIAFIENNESFPLVDYAKQNGLEVRVVYI